MSNMPLIRTRSPIRSLRRERQWGITSVNTSIVSAGHAGQKNIDLMAGIRSASAYQMPGVTASALRFNVNYRPTSWAAGDDVTVACGVIWATDRAIAAGGVSLPNPDADDADWMFHDLRTMSAPGNGFDTADSDIPPHNSQLLIRNDSMRKQRENDSTLVMIFESVLLQSTSLQIFVGGRALFLLP